MLWCFNKCRLDNKNYLCSPRQNPPWSIRFFKLQFGEQSVFLHHPIQSYTHDGSMYVWHTQMVTYMFFHGLMVYGIWCGNMATINVLSPKTMVGHGHHHQKPPSTYGSSGIIRSSMIRSSPIHGCGGEGLDSPN